MQIVRQIAYKQVLMNVKLCSSPIFVILDDTICEKTKPSSQASFSIQGASYHHSHLNGKTSIGHAVVQTMLRSVEVIYPFDCRRYEPNGTSKIQLACEMIKQIPTSSKQYTYVLMDSWYLGVLLNK